MSEHKTNYLHGFSEVEQMRLRKQAKFGEHMIYNTINLSNVTELLEVGCGVGAQSEILLRRFPDLKLTGIDRSEKQLAVAEHMLAKVPYALDRYTLKEMDAGA
ncbi:MAG: class I SAM-dependent methyltransferase, partial [Pseudobdellovibrio sp.]